MKQVGIWLRVSTDMQVETDAVKHHELRARGYCKSKGWKIVEVYDLSGVSGKTVMKHPETRRMLNDIRDRKISALVFSKLARLARNTRELLDIAEIFQRNDAGLVSLQESIDTTTAGGRLFFTMLAATTQFERDEISSRVSASVPIRAKLGKPLGGQAPFGYKWEDKKLIPNEVEAPIRKKMYELFDLHRRKKVVARMLNEKGYRTRGGAKFSDTSVDRLLRDTTAKGIHRRNYSKTRGKGLQWDLKDQSEWIFNEVEPIVSEALWQSCNSFLDEQRARLKRSGRPSKHLFAGILKCACGNKMYTYKSLSTYACKACKNKVEVNVLEDIYASQLKEFLTSEAETQSVEKKANHFIETRREELSTSLHQHRKIIGQMERYEQMFLDDSIEKDRFKELHNPIYQQSKELLKSIEELKSEIESLQKLDFKAEKVMDAGKTLIESWNALARRDKRRLVESITEVILIGEDSIDISFTYAPFLKTETKQHISKDYRLRPIKIRQDTVLTVRRERY